jgi:hypothetical protein
VAIIVIALLTFSRRPPAIASAVGITFLGYTNSPVSNWRYALFSVSNQGPYTVKWGADSVEVEVEGVAYYTGPAVHPNLSGFTFPPELKGGRSMLMAIGEPIDLPKTGRWKFTMSFSRYSWRMWWLDHASRWRLPLRIGSIVLVDAQRIYNPSNYVAVTTVWLTK